MPRMTNTYMLAGDDAPEDILRSVKRGLYAVNSAAARWTSPTANSSSLPPKPTSSKTAKSPPVRDATLIGNGPEALNTSPWSATTSS